MVRKRYYSKNPQDTGCKYADEVLGHKSLCLKCPFTDCILDMPQGIKNSIMKAMRNQEILNLVNKGINSKNIAKDFGITARTVQRIVAGRRNNEQLPSSTVLE